MKVFRKILGVVVLLLAVMFAAIAAIAALHKLGQLPPMAQLAPYLSQVTGLAWWLIAVCGASGLFYLISALSLLRNTRQALIPYLAGLAASAVMWWFVHQAPDHGMTFAVAGRECEIGFGAFLVVLGVLVAISDRTKRYRPSAD